MISLQRAVKQNTQCMMVKAIGLRRVRVRHDIPDHGSMQVQPH